MSVTIIASFRLLSLNYIKFKKINALCERVTFCIRCYDIILHLNKLLVFHSILQYSLLVEMSYCKKKVFPALKIIIEIRN